MKVVRSPEIVLYPNSVVLASCSHEGKDNIITLAWVTTACFDPPMIACAIRESRYSHDLVKTSGEFVINIPTSRMVRETDFCGQVSGRNEDKFAACKFTKEKASRVNVPLIGECPVNIECVVREVVHLGTHDLFIGEVVAVQVDEDLISDGKIEYRKAFPMAYARGDYWTLGEMKGTYGFSVKS
ncbi:MAG: flavin reductase family protein [Theionarchaea archaeon]|nr:flavin reductase family protein [Theionarchaea archaeon]